MRFQVKADPSTNVLVITQFDDDGRVRNQTAAQRVGPVAVNDETLFILDGGYVSGWVHRSEVRGASIESRPSFKHPAVGFAFGAVLAGAPIALLARGITIDSGRTFLGLIVLLCLILAGGYLLVAAATNRMIPWLIVETDGRSREFPLSGDVTEPARQLIAELARASRR